MTFHYRSASGVAQPACPLHAAWFNHGKKDADRSVPRKPRPSGRGQVD